MPQLLKARNLADDHLLQQVAYLVSSRAKITADLLVYLGEVDARRLYAETVYTSMHAWCVGQLNFSEASAFRHITAARLARRLPAVLPAVDSGALHLTGLTMLAPHLDADNVHELLASSRDKSKRDIDKLVAARFPKEDGRATLRPPATVGSPVPIRARRQASCL